MKVVVELLMKLHFLSPLTVKKKSKFRLMFQKVPLQILALDKISQDICFLKQNVEKLVKFNEKNQSTSTSTKPKSNDHVSVDKVEY